MEPLSVASVASTILSSFLSWYHKPPPGVYPPNLPLPESSVQPGQEPSSNDAPSRKRTFGDRAEADLKSLLESLLARSETSSGSRSSPFAGFLQTTVTPKGEVSHIYKFQLLHVRRPALYFLLGWVLSLEPFSSRVFDRVFTRFPLETRVPYSRATKSIFPTHLTRQVAFSGK